jgi:UDP-glucose 4-epimerase
MKKRFLVTGGCGFIGSHLCDALLAQGHAVRVLDDLSSGSRANLHPQTDFIEGDVVRPDVVRAALQGVDGCFHLAAIASVSRGAQDWTGTHRVNLTGTIVLLDEIRRLASARPIPFVYASSAAVYGDCDTLPLTEACVTHPLSAYGADKLASELHARVATAAHGIPTIGLRFFNVFGPRQNPASPYSGVISIFSDRLERGEEVEIFGDGQQTRDFIYVRDAVTSLVQAMAICSAGAPVFNVCSGRSTSIRGIAGVIAGLCGVPLEARYRPARPGDIRHSAGSAARARVALGLPEPVSLRQGLAEVLEWIGNLREPAWSGAVLHR